MAASRVLSGAACLIVHYTSKQCLACCSPACIMQCRWQTKVTKGSLHHNPDTAGHASRLTNGTEQYGHQPTIKQPPLKLRHPSARWAPPPSDGLQWAKSAHCQETHPADQLQPVRNLSCALLPDLSRKLHSTATLQIHMV